MARQEVAALRSRVQQLESDTASSSSLELKHLSLRQVSMLVFCSSLCPSNAQAS